MDTGADSPALVMPVEPFVIRVDEEVLDDLGARICNTRWPDQLQGVGWDQGTDCTYLRPLLEYWADGFDWRSRERWLNSFGNYRVRLDDVRIHFVHEKARSGDGLPLLLGNGWPSTFAELLHLVPFLTDPKAHGIDGPAFDVVIPSLPGYGFSERPAKVGINYRYTADVWHRLMRGLGYERYGVHGGDFGGGVAALMGLDNPEPLVGIHLIDLDVRPDIGPGSTPLSAAERVYLVQNDAWLQTEGGYKAIQATKPQTLAYALNDSPAGLAAWILEKWRSWSDSGGDLDARFSRDFLLTNLTIYWTTQSITTSMRDYYDNRWFSVGLGPEDFVDVPTGFVVTRQFAPEGEPPRKWVERLYDVRHWTVLPRGGHFLAAEEPELLARDIAAFFATVR